MIETTSQMRQRVPVDRLPENTEDERAYRFLYGDAELARRGLSYQSNYPDE